VTERGKKKGDGKKKKRSVKKDGKTDGKRAVRRHRCLPRRRMAEREKGTKGGLTAREFVTRAMELNPAKDSISSRAKE